MCIISSLTQLALDVVSLHYLNLNGGKAYPCSKPHVIGAEIRHKCNMSEPRKYIFITIEIQTWLHMEWHSDFLCQLSSKYTLKWKRTQRDADFKYIFISMFIRSVLKIKRIPY